MPWTGTTEQAVGAPPNPSSSFLARMSRGAIPPNIAKFNQTCRELKLISSADPTGGTFLVGVNPGSGAVNTATIAWNAAAMAYGSTTSVQYKIQAVLDGFTGNAAGWKCYVVGGTWPKVPYVVWMVNSNPSATVPTLTLDTSALTGGTSVSGVVCDTPICQDTISTGNATFGELLVDCGVTAPTTAVSNGTGTITAAYFKGALGYLVQGTNGASAPSLAYDLQTIKGMVTAGAKFDVREYAVAIQFYNPTGALLSGTVSLSTTSDGSSSNSDYSFTLSTGYSEVIVPIAAGTTVDISQMRAVRISLTAYNSLYGYNTDGVTKVVIGKISLIGRIGGRSTLSIVSDDHLASMFQTYLHTFDRYPIPIGIAAVKSWAIAGNRNSGTNTDAAATLTTAQIKALCDKNPKFYALTHTKTHYRLNGVNPNSVASTAQVQAIQLAQSGLAGNFRLSFDGGTTKTTDIDVAACRAKTVSDAINTLLGAGTVTKCELWHPTNSALDSTHSIRITFASPQPIMTTHSGSTSSIADPSKVVVGAAFTKAEIVDEFMDNAAWFNSQGISMPSNIWIPPQGAVCDDHFTAMAENGVRVIRSDAPHSGGFSTFAGDRFGSSSPQARHIPTRTFASGTTANEWFEGCMGEILKCALYGRHLCGMMHGISVGGGATDLKAADAPYLFQALHDLHMNGMITLMRLPDQIDYLESIGA